MKCEVVTLDNLVLFGKKEVVPMNKISEKIADHFSSSGNE